MKAELLQTKQCETCPWKKSITVDNIPNYSVETHEDLWESIADETGNIEKLTSKGIVVMTCHKSIKSPCVGWLHNQLGKGNNIPLRLQMGFYSNAKYIQVEGEQKETFEETFQ